MNKRERTLKGQNKFLKRLKTYGIDKSILDTNPRAHAGLRTATKPCSCCICSPGKYDGQPKYKYKQKHKKINK